MRVAVIDMGSNSIRLLLGEYTAKKVVSLDKRLITTRLGRGVAKNGRLDEASMHDTISALEFFKKIAKDNKCDKILAFATSAVREAVNGKDFIHIIREKIGIDVEIISGEKEGVLSFKGARAGLGIKGSALVVDIGGGSTEFCVGDDEGFESFSIPAGAVRLTQKYLHSDPPIDEEIQTAQSAVNELMENFVQRRASMLKDGFFTAVGVGGTITSLAAMIQKLTVYDPAKVHGFSMKQEDVKTVFESLCRMTTEERKKIPGISPQRADIITAGVIILRQIMQKLDISVIKASESDLMEGYIIENVSDM
ncbi:MAG: exopolyphosphatase / guanosine-5-triphosphate,3-diphosphate pyrophosphatase [Tepidanaerobacteraceae bacterium]|nr:exopolyphosphatase / guanosine-5-triphosphate,3-diphosphate pyrophosphatase [Tepidanaerobacteraceae bacterium]